MEDGPRLSTARLLLRRWREADLEPFAAMNADPEDSFAEMRVSGAAGRRCFAEARVSAALDAEASPKRAFREVRPRPVSPR